MAVIATLGLVAALAVQPPAEDNIFVRVDALPEADGVQAREYLGLDDAYLEMRDAAAELWLDRSARPHAWVSYTARPAFGQNGYRLVRFYWRWGDPVEGRPRPRYVYARRLIYTNADLSDALERGFPLTAMVEAFEPFREWPRSSSWSFRRERLMPDPGTLARLVEVRREILDEPTCPPLTDAIRALNLLEVPPFHVSGYGPDRRPEGEPPGIVVTGDGTAFELELPAVPSDGQAFRMVLKGNHGSVPGEWIDQFEAAVADCWRPDDGAEPPAP